MKNIKAVVHVMNLYSLVRINSAKKKADDFGMTSSVLTKIISSIVYNDNIIFDKHSIEADNSKPVLNIYIASDFGFCSSYNSLVSAKIKETKDDYKIIVGKKISYNDDKTILKIAKKDFYNRIGEIKDIITNALNNKEYSKIMVYYNHYHNFTNCEFKSMQLFPVEYSEEYKDNVDFLIETDIEDFINNLFSYYATYQLEICEVFSWAAENVIRNTTTSQSSKKIDELEGEEKIRALREEREKNLKKNIDNAKKNHYIIRQNESS